MAVLGQEVRISVAGQDIWAAVLVQEVRISGAREDIWMAVLRWELRILGVGEAPWKASKVGENNRQLAPWKNTEKYTENIRICFCPFLADFGQNWSKMASPGPGRASKGFLDALGCILAKYQPKRSHGDPLHLNFDIFRRQFL